MMSEERAERGAGAKRSRAITVAKATAAMLAAQAAFAGYAHAQNECPPEICQPPSPAPVSKEACKDGGYAALGFKNQGQCVKAANHAS